MRVSGQSLRGSSGRDWQSTFHCFSPCNPAGFHWTIVSGASVLAILLLRTCRTYSRSLMSSQLLIRYTPFITIVVWTQSRVDSHDRLNCTHIIMPKIYLFWNITLNTASLQRFLDVLSSYFTYLMIWTWIRISLGRLRLSLADPWTQQ